MQKLKNTIYIALILILLSTLIFLSKFLMPTVTPNIKIISGNPPLNPYTLDNIIDYMAYYGYTEVAVAFSDIKNNTLLPLDINSTANLLLSANSLAKNVFKDIDISVISPSDENSNIAVATISATMKQEPIPASISTASDDCELYGILVNNFKKDIFKFYVEISPDNNIKYDLNLLLKAAANDEIFWQNPVKLSISEPLENLLYIDVEFDGELKETLSNKHLVLSMKNIIAKNCEITDDMSDKERISKIHDAILSTVEYNKELESAINNNSLTPDDRLLNSAYGALIQTSTACTGYSQAIKLLCDHFGIECYTVTGTINGIGHMWNIVNLDNSYYYIDSTIADTTEQKLPIMFPLLMRGTDKYSPSAQMFHPLNPLPGVEISDIVQPVETPKVKLIHNMW